MRIIIIINHTEARTSSNRGQMPCITKCLIFVSHFRRAADKSCSYPTTPRPRESLGGGGGARKLRIYRSSRGKSGRYAIRTKRELPSTDRQNNITFRSTRGHGDRDVVPTNRWFEVPMISTSTDVIDGLPWTTVTAEWLLKRSCARNVCVFPLQLVFTKTSYYRCGPLTRQRGINLVEWSIFEMFVLCRLHILLEYVLKKNPPIDKDEY